MEQKSIIIIALVAIIVILGGVVGYFVLSDTVTPSTKTTIDLYNNQQNSVDSIINIYKNNPRVDNDTIKWLESLDSSYVILNVLDGGVSGFVVMKRDEANKIPNDNDTSVMTKVVIEGYVKESHSLDGISDVNLIEEVEFVKRQPI